MTDSDRQLKNLTTSVLELIDAVASINAIVNPNRGLVPDQDTQIGQAENARKQLLSAHNRARMLLLEISDNSDA